MKNKRGISVIVSYVLLIVIAVGVSIGVYSYLRLQVPKDRLECNPDIALSVQKYSCNTTTNELVVFSGDSFPTRNQAEDIRYEFSEFVKLNDVSLSGDLPSDGNDHEIVFEKLSGSTTDYGSITIMSHDRERTLTISPDGIITRD